MEKFFFNHVKNKHRVFHFLELARPWNAFLISLVCFLGYLLNFGNIFSLDFLFLIFLFFVSYMAGTTLNDVLDIDVDSINMSFRPLPRGAIKLKEAYFFSFFLYLVALSFSFLFNLFLFVGIISFVILSLLYSLEPFVLCKRGLLANITLALVSITLPLITASMVATSSFYFSQNFLNFIFFLSLFFLSITFFKDFKDIAGDSLHGKKTLSVLLGVKKVKFLGLFISFISFPLSVYFLSLLSSLSYFSLIFFLLVFILFLFVEFYICENTRRFFMLRILFLIYVFFSIVFVIY
jgi:4-hydroxybenzoate polyprenyltransferase